jgi:hypothetical protein
MEDKNVTEITKTCNTCLIVKKLDCYTNNVKYRLGKENKCKQCVSEYNKKNREKLTQIQRKWREKNPEYMKEYGKKDLRLEYQKTYYKLNKEKYREFSIKWRVENKDKWIESRNIYIEKNRERNNEYHRNWKKEKRMDPGYKIKNNLSRSIRYHLCKSVNCKKTKETIDYIGCSIDELKEYLQSKFTEDLSWSNYGTVWHIDHIIPCSSWDFTKEEEKFYCWNFRNLQPLRAQENQSKRDKFDIRDKENYICIMKSIFNPPLKTDQPS